MTPPRIKMLGLMAALSIYAIYRLPSPTATSPIEEAEPENRWRPMAPPHDHDSAHRGMCVYVMGLGINAKSGIHWERWTHFRAQMERAGRFPITVIESMVRSHKDHAVPCLKASSAGYVGMWATIRHVLQRATKRCRQDWVLPLILTLTLSNPSLTLRCCSSRTMALSTRTCLT